MSKRAPRKNRASEAHSPVRGKVARTDVLRYSEPQQPIPRKEAEGEEQPGAAHPLVGSDVLDAIGTGGTPRRAMHDVIHAPGDEISEARLGPEQEANVSFHPDPELADAGADLAEDLGRTYLQSATTGEDMSELENDPDTDPSEVGGPFIEDEEDTGEEVLAEPGGDEQEPPETTEPRPPRRPRRPQARPR